MKTKKAWIGIVAVLIPAIAAAMGILYNQLKPNKTIPETLMTSPYFWVSLIIMAVIFFRSR